MSSSNLVRVAFIEETVYGTTPAVGDFETARFTSEALSGSPETTESQQIRVDRMSSGQVVTGLTVGGALNFELAKEDATDLFFKSMMFDDWTISGAVTVDLTIDATAKTMTRATGDWNVDSRVGDILTLTNFTASANNTEVMIGSIDSATVIGIVGKDLVDGTGVSTAFQVADYLEIGTDKTSFAMEKAFLDLTTKAINYNGMIVGEGSINAAYGAIVTGSFTMSGNGYDPAEAAADFMTNTRTINSAATTNSLNGSVDMPFIASDASGTFENSQFCIQSVDMTFSNNLQAKNCVGIVAPKDYSEGTAQIGVTLNAYLSDDSWPQMEKKLSQVPFSLGFIVKNTDGFYGFYMPAIQVTFDDPASGGQNTDVMINMTGTAKVGASGESSLRIYRS